LLAVPIGEHRPFSSDAIYVWRSVAHDAMVVSADIEPADVISPDNQYIWFAWHEVLPFIENFFLTSKRQQLTGNSSLKIST
jgi:hypothetical protein